MDETTVSNGDGAREAGEAGRDETARPMERGEKRVPVSEAVKYRKRAQEAEASCEALERSLEALRTSLDESREMLHASERARHVDASLSELRAVDLETARAMLQREVEGEPDAEAIREAARELKKRKPFLFRTSGAPGGASSMGGRPRQQAGPLETSAREASQRGDRKALMRYLWERREADGAS